MNNENNNITNELNLMEDFTNALVSEPTIEPAQPVQPVPTVQPAQPVQPVPTVQPVPPVKPVPTVQPVPTVKPVSTESPIQDIKTETGTETPQETVLSAQEKKVDETPWKYIFAVYGIVAIFVIFLPFIFKMLNAD